MRRRSFLTLLGTTAAAGAPEVMAQQAIPVIGFLNSGSAHAFQRQLDAFRQGLKELGYVEGRNVAIDYRWADGRQVRLPGLAAVRGAVGPTPSFAPYPRTCKLVLECPDRLQRKITAVDVDHDPGLLIVDHQLAVFHVVPKRWHAAHPQALLLGGGILSRTRSPMTSRSNWAKDSNTKLTDYR